jgi:tRNA threonylcarbamoyl adenosine modification protein YeaZ
VALEPTVTRTVLAIDTATPAVIVGVLRRRDDGHIDTLAQRVAVDAHAHAELLTPTVIATVADAGSTLGAMDAVVVGCGPGPFTGLRVGMATAAALGHALDVPVHGVCSLDGIGNRTVGEVLVVTDARRREVYWARYRDGARIDGPGVAAAPEVPVGTAQRVAGSPAHRSLFDLPPIEPTHPVPAGLVAAVVDWDGTAAPLVPLYLRRPDAKTLAERGVAR